MPSRPATLAGHFLLHGTTEALIAFDQRIYNPNAPSLTANSIKSCPYLIIRFIDTIIFAFFEVRKLFL